jgi:hypothetical protein
MRLVSQLPCLGSEARFNSGRERRCARKDKEGLAPSPINEHPESANAEPRKATQLAESLVAAPKSFAEQSTGGGPNRSEVMATGEIPILADTVRFRTDLPLKRLPVVTRISRVILSCEFDGKLRRLYAMLCSECGATKHVPQSRLRARRFCSSKCRDAAKRKQVHVSCAGCANAFTRQPSKLVKSKSGLHFCSRLCKEKAQRLGGLGAIQPGHYGHGSSISTYRERALRDLPKQCLRCGYGSDVRMLDVDHVDGDRSNNGIQNLQILCVWCHALKTRGVDEHFRACAEGC